TLDRLLVTRHSASASLHGSLDPDASKCKVFLRESTVDEVSIEAAFQISNAADGTGEMTSGRGEDSCLADHAAELIAEPSRPGLPREEETVQKAAALRQPEAEQVAHSFPDRPIGVTEAAQRLVEHDRYPNRRPDRPQAPHIGVR